MARVIKVFKVLRNNWKKSTLGAVLCYYGIDYLVEKERSFSMMKEYCAEANRYGDMPLPLAAKNKHITLLLNPASANRKGKTKFEKFSEPILQLSGFLVSVVKTEKVSEAQELAKLIDTTNIIAVAGGDGTLFEVITGLLRREDSEDAVKRFPIAIIPTGFENKFAKRLFHNDDRTSHSQLLAESTMAIVKHRVEPKDVIEIKLSEENATTTDTDTTTTTEETSEKNDDQNQNPAAEAEPTDTDIVKKKPFYAMSGITLGQFREAKKAKDDLPNFLGKHFGTFWSHLRKGSQVVFKAEVKYLSACEGCTKCQKEEPKPVGESYLTKVWNIFSPKKVYAQEIIEKPECGVWNEMCIDTCEFNIKSTGNGNLEMEIGEKQFGRIDLIVEGFRRLKGQPSKISKKILMSEALIKPIQSPEFLSIDNEEFETKPLHVKILRNKIYFFTNPNSSSPLSHHLL